MILAIFVLSGAAALIDEIVWSRQLVLVFGNTTQAVSAILAGLLRRHRHRQLRRRPDRRPGPGAAADVRLPRAGPGRRRRSLTPISFRLINGLYRGIYPSLESSPQALALLRVAMAVLALAPATILMGATLPTLTRHLARDATLSGAFSRLYAANTIGAIVGTVARRVRPDRAASACPGRSRSGPAARPRRGSPRSGWLAAPAPADAEPVDQPLDAREPTRPTRRRRHAAPHAGAAPRPDRRLHLRPDVPRLPGHLDPAARLGDGQHDLRLHDDPRDVPHRDRARGGALRGPADADRRSAPAARRQPGRRCRARARSASSSSWSPPHVPTPGKPIETLRGAVRLVGPRRPARSRSRWASRSRRRRRCSQTMRRTPGRGPAGCSRRTRSARSSAAWSCRSCSSRSLGSPVLVAVLALVNARCRRSRSAGAASRDPPDGWIAATGAASSRVVIVVTARPARASSSSPNEAYIDVGRRQALRLDGGRDRLGPGRARSPSRPELWVAGTSMTLLTVDAKLMPILPLIARPESTRALVVAFGMGSAFRGALIAGLHDRRRRARPERARRCSATTTPTPTRSSPNPNGRVIVTDGRNHLELDRRALRHHRHRPAAADRELGRLGHLVEGVLRGGPRPPDRRRDHDAVGPVRRARGRLQRPHPDVRRRSSRRSRVVKGPGGYGVYMLGSSRADRLRRGGHPRRSSRGPASSRTSRPPTTRRRRPSTTGSTSSAARRG